MIERDNYVVWVLSKHLIDYTNNWLERLHDGGALKMLERLGLQHGAIGKQGVDYHVTRIGNGAVVSVEFAWGSSINVYPGANLEQLDNAVGGSCDLIIVDEAQKIAMLRDWLSKTAIPATKDRGGEILLTGTPGDEIGSLFHSVSSGIDSGWEMHKFFSWDNPHFGETFEERFYKSTVAPLEADRETLRVTVEQMDVIRSLTREQAENIQDILPDLYQDRLTEDFGVWPANPSLRVFPTAGITDERLYWGPAWAEGEVRHCIEQEPEDALAQTRAWREVFAALPRRIWNTASWPKKWTGLVGCDLGHDPDAFSLWAGVYSAEDEALREIDAFKCLRLDDGAQFAALRAWVSTLHELCEGRLGAVVIDASGPAASMGAGWRKRLTPYLPEEAIVTSPEKSAKYAQIKAFNADTAAGKLLLRRNSPTDVERRYLWWQRWNERFPGRRRDVDKRRKVHIADGYECMPADHALDACRYAWWHSYRGVKQEEQSPPATPEQVEVKQHEAWERGQQEPVPTAKVHTWRKTKR